MSDRVFVAGASGAIGRPLCSLLRADGWQVIGTTRSTDRARTLQADGIAPVVVDVFDLPALQEALQQARPDVVIHQLTDLPFGLDPAKMDAARVRNTRIRDEGTRNLLTATLACGARRIIAQSIAFAYAPGPTPYTEDSPLDANALGVISLERQILTAPIVGIVLRYGRLYGPGTGASSTTAPGPVHVDAAADAARRATLCASNGIFNVAEDDGTVDSSRARQQLGWRADFRIP